MSTSILCMAEMPSLLHFDNTLGAMYIGLLIATLLTGIACLQTYIYFLTSGKKDALALQVFIAFLWVLDMSHTVFGAHFGYSYMISNYANPLALRTIHWSGIGVIISTRPLSEKYVHISNLEMQG
ncbi:hypothetical protein ABKN59_004921 [Abortiporus biennis]